MEMFAPQESVVLDAIRRCDVESLTPLAALNLVASFQNRITTISGSGSGTKKGTK